MKYQRKPEWTVKFQEMIHVCQDELKRTTEIGKRMLSASKSNSSMHEAYEELGHLIKKALENDEVKWENSRAQELVESISACEKELNLFETEVNDIRFKSTDTEKKPEDDKNG